jgi:hypothetical protein
MKCGIRISDCGVKTRKTMDDGKEKLIAEFGLRLRRRPSLRPRRAYGPEGGASAPEGEPSGSERLRNEER